jgi:hypothetical protein
VPEPPLSDRELRILRGVIDEHEYRAARDRFLGESWRGSRAIVIAIAGAMLFGLQVVTLVVAIRHGNTP